MKKIQNKEDVLLLVTTFYQKIKQDETLGPIFTKHIQAEQWPAHMNTLTNFWMTNLFGIKAYKGNPTKVHRTVDKMSNHTITPSHFGQWLNLWFTTIDDLFEGDTAIRAKDMARKMATRQYLSIWKQRM